MVREVQHIGPDGQPVVIDPYNPYGEYAPQTGTYGRNGSASSLGVGVGQQPQRFANYEHIAEGADYRTHSPAAAAYGRTVAPANYADYEPYPHLAGGARGGVGGQILVGPPPDYAYQTAQPPGLYRDYPDMMDPANAGALPMYGERPPTPPSPSEQSESPLPHHSRGKFFFRVYFLSLFPLLADGPCTVDILFLPFCYHKLKTYQPTILPTEPIQEVPLPTNQLTVNLSRTSSIHFECTY